MKRIFLQLTLSLIITTLTLTGCANANASNTANEAGSSDKLSVVATTGQIHDALHNIAGDTVNLVGLLGPGIDPHLYVPTEGDVGTFSEADVIVYNGLHLEAQMVRVLEQMEQRGVVVLAVGDGLPEDQLLDWDTSAFDPHVWNDPMLWSLGIEAMRDVLVEADPDNADIYNQNTETYLTEIEETHAFVQEQISRIPAEKRLMITAHDAFGYFARAYGMEVAGLQGISTESEASTADVQNLATMIVERQVPAIFVETSVSPRNIEAVQAAVKAQGFEVVIGGSLFSDALDSPGEPASTYIGMLRHNAQTLADALSK
ncbi:MAG: zinc ABC transporter substrate-binding protein [Chloroflexota bacterium]